MAKVVGISRKLGVWSSVAALALSPAAVLAVAASSLSLDAADPFGTFTPAGVDSELARHFDVNQLSDAGQFAFTPAGGVASDSVMIVVRAPHMPASNLAGVRQSVQAAELGVGAPVRKDGVKLAAISYDLGAAKGLQSFALPEKAVRRKNDDPVIGQVGKGVDFKFDNEPKKRSIAPRIVVEEGRAVSAVPRDVSGVNDYKVDLGGRVSVTKGIDLTAGVRLENDRSQDQRLTNDQRDNQAVYVGTMIKF